MVRRIKRLEHDNHDRWLISYADFVTLLFAFFVVMYSISSVNEEKYKTFGVALNSAFGKQVVSGVSPTISLHTLDRNFMQMVDRQTAKLGEQQRRVQDQMKSLQIGLNSILSELIAKQQVNVNRTRRGVEVDISASALFGTGEVALQPETVKVLKHVAQVIGKEGLQIEVEGHTDDVPIATSQFPSNWELSSARASSVVRMLIDNGVPASHLAAVGLASYKPRVPNDSVENRSKNRRVTIIIISPDIERDSAAPERKAASYLNTAQ